MVVGLYVWSKINSVYRNLNPLNTFCILLYFEFKILTTQIQIYIMNNTWIRIQSDQFLHNSAKNHPPATKKQ